MKPKLKKSDKVSKGAPSGFVISLIFHAAAFFVAGLFVVFTVLPKEEPEFKAPPPVERPKMKLKKPKVKIKKSSQPKPSSRIVAKVKTAKMPEIQIPDLMGTGTGLLGGLGAGGDFMDLPEPPETLIFGSETTTGNDLVGVYYDLNRTRDGLKKVLSRDDVYVEVHKFFERDWNPTTFSRYYRSPTKLYTSTICVGTVNSSLAPEAFGEYETEGWGWVVLYKGKLVYPEDIKFRFRGVGDKINGVRVDGKVVLLCVYRKADRLGEFSDIWDSNDGDSDVYPMAEGVQTVGDWIELKAGVPVDIEVLLSEPEGGLVYHQLVVEVEGMDYPRNPYKGGPTCPVFRTDILPRALVDALMVDVYPGDVCLTNGPVFCDYIPEMLSMNQPLPTNPPPPYAKEVSQQLRSWTSVSGSKLEAELMMSTSEYVLLEKTDGAQVQIPLVQLSEEDKRFVSLAKPPKFKLEFSKRSDQVPKPKQSPYDIGNIRNPRPLGIFDYTFGVRVKQASPGEYNHELKIEYFAILDEFKGDRYILAERKSDTFTPSKENNYSHEFYGQKIRSKEYGNRARSPVRGTKYKGHNLIVVTDEEGRLVEYRASNEFLFENLAKLRALPINSYFDKHCNRMYPTRPTDDDRP